MLREAAAHMAQKFKDMKTKASIKLTPLNTSLPLMKMVQLYLRRVLVRNNIIKRF